MSALKAHWAYITKCKLCGSNHRYARQLTNPISHQEFLTSIRSDLKNGFVYASCHYCHGKTTKQEIIAYDKE